MTQLDFALLCFVPLWGTCTVLYNIPCILWYLHSTPLDIPMEGGGISHTIAAYSLRRYLGQIFGLHGFSFFGCGSGVLEGTKCIAYLYKFINYKDKKFVNSFQENKAIQFYLFIIYLQLHNQSFTINRYNLQYGRFHGADMLSFLLGTVVMT